MDLILNPDELQLYKLLNDKCEPLAKFYYAAIMVLQQESNQERFVLAAHELRELMEKCPQYLNVAQVQHGVKLSDQLEPIAKIWKEKAKKSCCYKENGEWEGVIDQNLKTFLINLNDFFNTYFTPKRSDEIGSLITKFNAIEEMLPTMLTKKNWDQWKKINNFFQQVSHHQKITNDVEFELYKNLFETFIIERMATKVFDDFDEIDAIIKEGERT